MRADPFADEADAPEEDANEGVVKGKSYVHVRVQQRNGRKSLTTVQARCPLGRRRRTRRAPRPAPAVHACRGDRSCLRAHAASPVLAPAMRAAARSRAPNPSGCACACLAPPARRTPRRLRAADALLRRCSRRLRVPSLSRALAFAFAQGIDPTVDYKKVLKAFKKEFCCNGTVVEDPEQARTRHQPRGLSLAARTGPTLRSGG